MKLKNWVAGGALVTAAVLSAIAAPASAALASNGDVVIGTTATNGDIHVNTLTANDLGPDNQQAKHLTGTVSDADPVLDQAPPPTIRD